MHGLLEKATEDYWSIHIDLSKLLTKMWRSIVEKRVKDSNFQWVEELYNTRRDHFF